MLGGILATVGNYEVAHTVERMQDAVRRRAKRGKTWRRMKLVPGLKTPKGGTWKGTTLRMTQLNPRHADLRVPADQGRPKTATSAGGRSPTSQYRYGGLW